MGFEQQTIKIYPYTHAMSRPYFWDNPSPIKGGLIELVGELGLYAFGEHACPLQGFIPARLQSAIAFEHMGP